MDNFMESPSIRAQGDFSQAAALRIGWLVGAVTVALGAFGAFAAFAAPLLFGPLVAVVIAAERLLRATRAADGRLIACWLALALGWIALAACMLHSPLQNYVRLEAGATVLVLAGAASWAWSRAIETGTRRIDIVPIAAGTALTLGILYGGGEITLSRIAASASVALAVIGVEWVLMSIEVPGERKPAPSWITRVEPSARLPVEVA